MSEVVIPWGAVEDLPEDGALIVTCRHFTAPVLHGDIPQELGWIGLILSPKRDHRHTGPWPAREPLEGGGVADRHLSMSKPPDVQRLTRVQGRKRDGNGYNGVEARSRDFQNRPVPPLSGITGPK